MNLSQSIIRFLGLKKNMLALLGMVVLVGLGEKMAERFLPLYLVALGGGALSVGLLNGLDNLLSALYSFPGGYASDRLGYKRALALFNVLAMFGFLIVILFPIWPAVIVGSIFFLSWSAISLPATMSLIAQVLPSSKRTMGVSMHSLVRRVPMALGPVVGGLMVAQFGEITGVRLAFVAAFILGGASLWFQQLMITDDKRRERAVEANPFRVLTQMSLALRQLLLSDILVRFCEQIPYAFVVLWCVKIVGISPVQFGVLTAIEMAVAMLVYIPIAYLADNTAKKPFVVITFGFFALFPLVLLFSRSFWALVLAFVVRGLKEFGEPTRKALILDLAREGQEATMFGAYYLARDVIVSLAAFGGAFLWEISPTVNFLTAAGFGLVGLILFALFGKDLKDSGAISSC